MVQRTIDSEAQYSTSSTSSIHNSTRPSKIACMQVSYRVCLAQSCAFFLPSVLPPLLSTVLLSLPIQPQLLLVAQALPLSPFPPHHDAPHGAVQRMMDGVAARHSFLPSSDLLLHLAAIYFVRCRWLHISRIAQPCRERTEVKAAQARNSECCRCRGTPFCVLSTHSRPPQAMAS